MATFAKKATPGKDAAVRLWFSDQWEKARELDPDSTIWFEISEWEALKTWRRVRDVVLQEWIKTNPGRRPYYWWQFDAPRAQAGTFRNKCGHDIDPRRELPEPRRLLSGRCRPVWEVVAVTAHLAYGLPGRYDSYDDPPTYESEAEYLRRHKLLFPGELERCDFAPEVHRGRETPIRPVE